MFSVNALSNWLTPKYLEKYPLACETWLWNPLDRLIVSVLALADTAYEGQVAGYVPTTTIVDRFQCGSWRSSFRRYWKVVNIVYSMHTARKRIIARDINTRRLKENESPDTSTTTTTIPFLTQYPPHATGSDKTACEPFLRNHKCQVRIFSGIQNSPTPITLRHRWRTVLTAWGDNLMKRNNVDETKRGSCLTSVCSAYKKQDTHEFPFQKGIKRSCLLPLAFLIFKSCEENNKFQSQPSISTSFIVHTHCTTHNSATKALFGWRTSTTSNTPFIFSVSLPHTTESSLPASYPKHQASPLQTTESSLPSSYLTRLGITSAHYRILSTRNLS